MTDKEKTIMWFENIAYECDKLASGNVSHLKAQIKGMAIRSAEYLKKEESVSEDLEEAANQIVNKAIPTLAQKYKDGTYVGGIRDYFNRKEFIDLVKAGAKWQKEQMMKDAIETTIDGKVVKVIVIDE